MKAIDFGGAPARAGWFVRGLAACLVAGLAGCAAQTGSVPGEGRSAQAIVHERAQARWDALLKDQVAEAYKFYSPASRSVMSYEDFIRSLRVGFWKAARVDAVECQAEEACEVVVSIEYAHRGSRLRTPIRETWVRMDGTWWYVQKS